MFKVSISTLISTEQCCKFKEAFKNKNSERNGGYQLVQSMSRSGRCKDGCVYRKIDDPLKNNYCFAKSFIGRLKCADHPTSVGHVTPVLGTSVSSCSRKSLPPVDCSDQPDQTFFADPSDCQKFFQCDRGSAVPKTCEAGELWNDYDGKKICDWARNVDCCNGTGKYEGPCSDQLDNSFLPHPEDCQKFYQCDRGFPVEKECGVGTLWNQEIKNCDWPSNVKCPSI